MSITMRREARCYIYQGIYIVSKASMRGWLRELMLVEGAT